MFRYYFHDRWLTGTPKCSNPQTSFATEGTRIAETRFGLYFGPRNSDIGLYGESAY
jgi:hypothetical protein